MLTLDVHRVATHKPCFKRAQNTHLGFSNGGVCRRAPALRPGQPVDQGELGLLRSPPAMTFTAADAAGASAASMQL